MINDPQEFLSRMAGYDEEPSRSSRSATRRWASRKGYDPSKTEDYDVDQFYTRATNTHDHSSKVVVHIPRDQQVFYMKIVGSENTPYDTLADLCRDGLAHRAHQMRDRVDDPNFVPEFNVLLAKARAEDFRMEYEAQKALVEEATTMLNQLVSDRSWFSLADQIMSYQACVEGLKEPWSTRMQEVIDGAAERLPDEE